VSELVAPSVTGHIPVLRVAAVVLLSLPYYPLIPSGFPSNLSVPYRQSSSVASLATRSASCLPRMRVSCFVEVEIAYGPCVVCDAAG
jgi:hypothetical protein